MRFTLKRVLSAAVITGLTFMALSVVASTVVESRGPGADQLPQVSLPAPMDAGVVVAEATTSSAPSTLAPTVTTASTPTTTAPTATPSDSATTQPAVPTTIASNPVPRPFSTVGTVSVTEPPKERDEHRERTTTTRPESLASSTTDHVVVTPTVRENDDD